MFVLWFRVPVAPVLGCVSVQPQSVSVDCLLGFSFNSIAEILPKQKKPNMSQQISNAATTTMTWDNWHDGAARRYDINKKIDNILKEQTKSQWTNLPLLSFHFYEHQLVQMLLNLKFHTSHCSLQNCATYTCRVVNQQIN